MLQNFRKFVIKTSKIIPKIVNMYKIVFLTALLVYFQALIYRDRNIENFFRRIKMKNKFLSVMLSGLMLVSMPIQMCANAAESNDADALSTENVVSVYTEGLIAKYALSCESGSKTVYINASVYGTDTMAKIGFKNIEIQRSSDNNNWTREKTVPNQIDENEVQKKLSGYSVSVKGGYYYRVVLDNYAKEDTWWFPETQTIEAVSNSVWVP